MEKKIVPREARLKWFNDARFGMFIHWGVYSIPARGEWVMHVGRIPADEYAPLAQRFKPSRFDADEWVALATAKGSTVYLHVFRWPGEEVPLAGVKNKVRSAHLLATGEEAEVVQRGERLFLRGLPRKAPDPHDAVIGMKVQGKPETM